MDSVYVVSGSEVVVSREKVFNAGTHRWQADSALLHSYKSNTLGDILGQQSGMFVRTFTPGRLATPIMRGTYGVHTNVVWNGFSLQSPMNQIIDLNLIPAFFIDDVSIDYGSQSALYGSGAVGGTIGIGQQDNAKNGLHVSVLGGVGSFETYQQGAKLTYKTKNYTGKLRYFNQISQNNYTYNNRARAGNPQETLTNAQWWQNGQLLENYFTIKKNITASLHAWHMQSYRGVAPLMFQNTSVAFQQDDYWRIMGDVKVRKGKFEGVVRMQYSDERIRYNDMNSAVPIDADNRAYSFVVEGELRYKWKPQHDVSFGVNNSYFRSTAGDYGNPPPVQYRPAIFLSYLYHSKNNKLFTSFTLRQEGVTLRNTESLPLLPSQLPGEFNLLPPVPTLGVDWNFANNFWWRAKISRVYRYPSFNDLYWNPGGNPELKPEDGFSSETRLTFKKQKGKLRLITSAGVFYNDIKNWIQWLQGAGGVFSPQNILSVVSRGIEYQGEVKYNHRGIELQFDGRYSYTVSTNEKEKFAGDAAFKKQLIYVPYHTVAANIYGGYKRFYIRVNGQYTGEQFISNDNTKALDAFNTLNVFVGKTVTFNGMSVDINLQARNILNEEYEVVEWLPMPRRNYLLSIQLNF